ncbi:hypothetical protein I552_1925 [Mycobacterium xenopi 3993]|nr:hypothetical protein I552_1925 [Mycobacterium xenopi 3993]
MIQGGRTGQHRNPFAFNEFQHTIDLEDRYRDHGGARIREAMQPAL